MPYGDICIAIYMHIIPTIYVDADKENLSAMAQPLPKRQV